MELYDIEKRFRDECEKDPKFFIEGAVKYTSSDSGIVPFKLWDVQLDLVDILHEYNALIINKCRQMGGSLTNLAYMLHYSLFNNGKNVYIMANRLSSAEHLLECFRTMLMELPECVKPKIITNKKRCIELENETRIFASAAMGCAVTGCHIDYLYMEEVAFGGNRYMKDFVHVIFPTMFSSETYKIVICSSPNGFNDFYRIWVGALLNDNNFKPVAIPWWTMPGKDEEWKADMISRIGKNRFASEFECKFIGNNILYPGQKEPRTMSFE